jgi:flavin-dependent dehydrogenase
MLPWLGAPPLESPEDARLVDGCSVAVLGSGPAGSFFAYFLLEMAAHAGLRLQVDLYEPRDFSKAGAQGCNMCGGIISESLVQNLAAEGVNLPPAVVQRGIDSYVLHMDVGSVRIDTPLHEKRIGAIHRGSGPRDLSTARWESFDLHLQRRALARGARLIAGRVDAVDWSERRPWVRVRDGERKQYDLIAVAVGVNSTILPVFEALNLGYRRPKTTKTVIREYFLGEDVIAATLGTSMHVFLLDIPRLEFAAIIPKGDYVTMCLLGEDVDNALIEDFVGRREVVACMPPGWDAQARSCQCLPQMNIRGADMPLADRLVFVGDCGVTRLYKDGIGGAYRTAKAAARTAVFEGVSAAAFRRGYLPACRRIARDNDVGRIAFFLTRLVQRMRLARRAMYRTVVAEQSKAANARRLSGVLWDMFSGSAPYKDIFSRMLHPALMGALARSAAVSAVHSERPVPVEDKKS